MVPPADTSRGVGQSWHPNLRRSVVRILDENGDVAGPGFVVGNGLIVTCAHVVANGDEAPDRPVSVEILQEPAAVYRAHVDAANWRPRNGADVAFLRCDQPLPDSVRPLALGASADAHGHRAASFGFPVNAPRDGHFGHAQVGNEIQGDGGSRLVQLTECSEVTEGFSGAPVLDEVTGLVIGMIDSVATVDRLGRGGTTAYATPTETLREIFPELALSTVCPYMGLAPFSSDHAEWFFGRERAVDAVLSRLRQDPRIVALLGPSGSGKSSLMNAGVIPALGLGGLPGSDQWATVTILPAELPDRNLVTTAAEAQQEEHHRVVLVFDQFEQLLVSGDDARRSELLSELTELPDRVPDVTVILVMRDDFFSRLAAVAPALMRRLERTMVNVPAVLERDELTAIITGPARAVRLDLEPRLAERIAGDAMAAAPPGTPDVAGAATTVLPLLEFTLTELWRRRADGRLTHGAYESLGGVTGGLAKWCERTYQSLPTRLKQVAERVLTALIEPGDERSGTSPVTRRRRVSDLHAIAASDADAAADPDPAWASGEDVDEVLGRLADNRLVVTRHDPDVGEATAELSHDALIREWPRLREWLEQDREFLIWHSWAEDQSDRWHSTGADLADRDPDLLLRGSALELANGWCEKRPVRADVKEFVEHSSRAEQHRRTRARRRVQVLTGLLVVAIALGVLAAVFAYRADESANRAEQQARLATSRSLAVAAQARLTEDPELAHLLALESLRTADTQETVDAFEAVLSEPLPSAVPLTGHEDVVWGVAFSEDGDVVATAGSEGIIRLWDRDTGDPVGEPITYADQEYGDAELARALGFGLVDQPLTGHANLFPGVALSPDGSLFAMIRDDGTVVLRDTTSGDRVGEPIGYDASVNDVTFNAASDQLITAGDDGTARRWDITTREQVGEPYDHDVPVERVAAGPHSGLLATAGADDVVELWVPPGGYIGWPIRLDGEIHELVFSPNDRMVATFSQNDSSVIGESNVARVWNPYTGEQLGAPLAHDFAVLGMAFSPDGDLLVTGDFNGTVWLWDAAADQPLGAPLPHEFTGEGTFSPDGDLFATPSGRGVLIWDTATGSLLAGPLPGEDDLGLLSLAFSPDGDLLTSRGVITGSLWLWNTAPGWPIGERLARVEGLHGIAFSPDAELLATAGDDGTVQLLDPATGEPVGDPLRHDDPVRNVVFSPDGELIATGTDGAARLWNPATGEPVGNPLPHSDLVFDLMFTPDGDLLATTSADDIVRLWDPATGEPVGDPLRHEDSVLEVAFSSDGDHLVTRTGDGPARLWSTAADRMPRALLLRAEGVHDVAFSQDGDLLATAGDDGEARLWDTATGDAIGDSLDHDDAVYSVEFSPDGDLLATGTDGTVRLWNPATGEPVGDPFPHSGLVQSLTFSPDGGRLAAVDGGSTVRLWAMPKTWIDHTCRRAGRNLSQAEWNRYHGDTEYVRTCPEFPAGPGADTDAPVADYSRLPEIFGRTDEALSH